MNSSSLTFPAGEQLLPDPTTTTEQDSPRSGELSNPDAPLCGKTRREILTRYDGIQKGLFDAEYWHCYTIIDESSPAYGASLTVEGEHPTADQLAAAVATKEAQFRMATFSHPNSDL